MANYHPSFERACLVHYLYKLGILHESLLVLLSVHAIAAVRSVDYGAHAPRQLGYCELDQRGNRIQASRRNLSTK